MRRMIVWAVAAVVLLVVLVGGWIALTPRWAAGLIATEATQQLGRTLDVKGGASLSFSPQLSISLDRVSLSNPDGMDGAFITADVVHIPVSVGNLLTGRVDLSALELYGAEFALLVNERNEASWDFPAVKSPAPLKLTVANGSMRFFDARTQQAFSIAGARMSLNISADGEVLATGTADIGGRLAKIDAALKSLTRVQADGSPLDLTIETPEGMASFSGRLATSGLLSLAGPVTIASPNLRDAASWAGLGVADGAPVPAFTAAGSLESAGRVFALRRGQITLGAVEAQGDLVLDLRGAIPKVQAVMSTPALDLGPFLMDSGRKPGQWGTKPLDIRTIKAVDADLAVAAKSVRIRDVDLGPAKVSVAATAGRLIAGMENGALKLEASLDATATPPGFGLKIAADAVPIQSFLPALVEMPWLSGIGTLTASLTGNGKTEEEIVGTLSGSVSLALADGTIAGPDIGPTLSAVSQRILDGWTGGGAGRTAFKILGVEATLADGIATLSAAQLGSDAVTVSAKGTVDLLRRAVELSLQPRIVDGSGNATGLPVPVIARGPWDKPRLFPDLPNILADPDAAYRNLKAMGLPPGN